MNLKPGELVQSGYELIERLEHQDLIPFVKKYMGVKTFYSRFYFVANVAIATMIAVLIILVESDTLSTWDAITHVSYGFFFAFMLIPLHEYIHVLAYRSQGAEQTSYDVNWKKFYFMAIADQFVANKKEFTIVALAPFVTISVALLLVLFFTDINWSFTVLGTLLVHAAFCSGDFGLLSFFAFHKDREILTYDDKASGLSYFYAKAVD